MVNLIAVLLTFVNTNAASLKQNNPKRKLRHRKLLHGQLMTNQRHLLANRRTSRCVETVPRPSRPSKHVRTAVTIRPKSKQVSQDCYLLLGVGCDVGERNGALVKGKGGK